MSQFFILQSQLKLKSKDDAEINDNVGMFRIEKNEVHITTRYLFHHKFEEHELNDAIERLQNYARNKKYTFSGFITIGEVSDIPKYTNLKITLKKVDKKPVTIKVVTRGAKATERKPPVSVELMLLHVREFVKEKKRLPVEGEVHEDVKVGNFVEKVKDEKQIYDALQEIIKKEGLRE